jgi:pyruvate ferredoxin oxidoreductase alpha subunit
MKPALLDGNSAAAWGGRLSRAQVVPNFPVTPQTELIEKFAEWKSRGEWTGEFLPVESEHSVLAAAIAASATGTRVFSGSSSQGLMLMHEMVYVASGMRVPVVMINVSRALSAPITLWPDHNDILGQRDSGWLIFFCESNQEVLDTVIQAYRICEDERVLLPAFVNMEGFVLSYTREPTFIPEQKAVDKFLPKFKPKALLDPKKPMAMGVGVMKEYPYFRNQAYLGQRNALDVIQEVHEEWEKRFGRKYGLVEEFMMDGAQACLVSMGANSSIAKSAVKNLRAKGVPIGLLRLRVYRPFPKEQIRESLKEVEAVGMIDQNLSPGYGGIVYPEIRDCLYDRKVPVSDFIAGLGGRHISQQELEQFGMEVLKSVNTKKEVVLWQEVD